MMLCRRRRERLDSPAFVRIRDPMQVMMRRPAQLVCLCLLLSCHDPPPAAAVQNVILISLDDVAASHVGSYGYQRDTTPNLDRLANSGIRYSTCIANANWTLPSHMSMLTGTRPRRHGVVDHSHTEGPTVPLLTQVLKARRPEIATGGFTDHSNLSRAFGFGRGFDEYQENTDEFRPPSAILDPARKFIAAHRQQPQFLFLHLFTAHWPHFPPPDLAKKFDPDYTGKVVGARVDVERLMTELRSEQDRRDFAHLQALYDAEIAYLDRELAAFIGELDLAHTLVIITADHGEAFREHGYYGHGISFEKEEIEVPLLLLGGPAARTPGVRGGRVAEIDLAPTILNALGVPPANTMEGVDLLGPDPDLDRALISESCLRANQLGFDRFAIWNGNAKCIFFPEVERYDKLFGDVLYDLTSDPHETTSVRQDRAELAARFRVLATARFGYEEREAFLVTFGASAAALTGELRLSTPARLAEMARMSTYDRDGGGRGADWVTWKEKDGAYSIQVLRQVPGEAEILGSPRPNGLFLLPAKPDARLDVLLAPAPRHGISLDSLTSAPLSCVASCRRDRWDVCKTTLMAFPDGLSGQARDLDHLPPELRAQLERTGYLGGKRKQ
ncbi:MAG: sulfatase [Planctomycetota bacterium]